MKKKEDTSEKGLLTKLRNIFVEMTLLAPVIGLATPHGRPYNPDDLLNKIDYAQRVVKCLWEWYHPDYMNEEALKTMTAELDDIKSRIYIAYASCKVTKLTNIYADELRKQILAVRNLLSPFHDK